MKQHYRVYVDRCNLNGGILYQCESVITSESLKDAIREYADWEVNLYTMLDGFKLVARNDSEDESWIQFKSPEGIDSFLSITGERWM